MATTPSSEDIHGVARQIRRAIQLQTEADESEFNRIKDIFDQVDPIAETAKVLGRLPRSGNPAAEWRLRCKRQYAIDDRLRSLGSLALLAQSSMLVASDETGHVYTLDRESRWKPTLIGSPIYAKLDKRAQGRVLHANFDKYQRIEEAIKSFGRMICLSVSDLESTELIVAFSEFKVWCVNHAFISEEYSDYVCEYIKWLCKAAQAVALQTALPDPPTLKGPEKDNKILPFVGELSFISSLIKDAKRRKSRLSMSQAYALTQIANTTRSLPYPSDRQIKASVKETVEIIKSRPRVPESALKEYRLGLNSLKNDIGVCRSRRSHVSLVATGTLEASRKEGGRARILVSETRKYTDTTIDFDQMEDLVDQLDQFGEVIVSKSTWLIAKECVRNREYKRPPSLGDILYLQPGDVVEQFDYALNQNKLVPKNLGKILTLTAAKLLMAVGEYLPDSVHVRHGVFTTTQPVTYHLIGPIKVRADLSIEAGMKVRIITCANAAFAHISQLPANLMREHLSKDPFNRTGFEEPDKLWQVLKQYSKQE